MSHEEVNEEVTEWTVLTSFQIRINQIILIIYYANEKRDNHQKTITNI